MLDAVLRLLLKNPLRQTAALVANPLETWTKLRDLHAERRERRSPIHRYEAEPEWNRRLHAVLGAEWPCGMISEFKTLWPDVIASLASKGIALGPMSFGTWNDGDTALVQAVWCLARHLRPSTVVETGVAHGVTSRVILEALEKNGTGHLWSIDRPPVNPVLRERIGIAVDKRFPDRWTYISGSSRRRLPRVVAKLGQIDLFIHDSLHSERNVRFEIDRAWADLRPCGAIVVDDIDVNSGFHSFCEAVTGFEAIVCESEPLRADPRRFNQKGLFGIIVKAPATGVSTRSVGPA